MTPSTAASSGCGYHGPSTGPSATGLRDGCFSAFASGSLALFPRIGQDFFPSVDAGQIRLHVRAPAGTRIEETERLFGQVEDAIREVVPDSERAMILDNMGLTQSFTIMAYVDNGTVSDADGEILVAPVHATWPTAGISRAPRRAAAAVPGLHVLLRAGGHHQPDPQLRPARPDRRPGGRRQPGGQPRRRPEKLRQEIAKVPGIADVHLHQMTDRPDCIMNVDRIERRRAGGLTAAGRGRQRAGVAQLDQPGVAQLLGQLQEWRQLPGRRPDALMNTPHQLDGRLGRTPIAGGQRRRNC